MNDDLLIQMEASGPVPRFRIRSASGERVSELGSETPIWHIIQEDGFVAEGIAAHYFTPEEAEGAQIQSGLGLAELASEYGAAVEHVTYGETPDGMRAVGEVGPLVPGRLYQILAFGPGVGTFEFRG